MFLNLFVEVILLTILVGGSYYGYKKGIFKLAAKPVKFLLSIAVSLFLCRTVGNYLIAPIILNRIDDGFREMAVSTVSAISAAIAFLLLLLFTRIIITLVISLASRFLDGGIVGRINRGLGFLLAAVVALLSAYGFVLLADYLLGLEVFENSSLAKDFSGGLLYRIFINLGYGGLLPSQ